MSELYYWNRANFEGLAAVAAALRADARLDLLAAYCDLRERGLRRQAFAQLDAFLDQMRSQDVQTQRDLAVRVLEVHWRTSHVYQFLSHPLQKQFLEPVLEQWRAAEADNAIPVRYLAILHRDRVLLGEALRMNPNDDQVRVVLVAVLIDLVDFATHHLVESQFIGDEHAASLMLAEAAAVLAGVTDAALAGSLTQDLERMHALLADWNAYQQAPEGSFPEWCRARSREHHWWGVIYYG